MKKSLALVFFFCCSVAYAQQVNKNWREDLKGELEQFKACKTTNATGISPCNKFIGTALTTVYKVNDFYSAEGRRHMLVSEISQYLKKNERWTLLGYGYDQKALMEAQQRANEGRAVVAVYLNEEGLGNLSVILPGELKPSGTWRLQVPNSASFIASDPEASYMDKGLSYAYDKPLLKGVLIYVRNY